MGKDKERTGKKCFHRALSRLAIVGVGGILAFLLMEGTIHTGLWQLSDDQGMKKFDQLLQESPDEQLSYEQIPLAETEVDGIVYRINTLGFRDKEYTVSKDPGIFRVIVLGDSFTFGLGSRLEETYPKQLERLMNGASRDRRYEVWNLGVRGYNALQEIRLLETKVLAFQPDRVVIGFFANDLFDPTWGILGGRLVKQVPRNQVFKRWIKSLFYRSAFAVYVRRGWGEIVGRWRSGGVAGASSSPSFPEEMWTDRMGVYVRMKDLLSEKGIPYLVVVISAVPRGNDIYSMTTKRFIEFCKNENIPFIDPIGRSNSEAIDGHTGHLSALGNRMMAKRILKEIRQRETIGNH